MPLHLDAARALVTLCPISRKPADSPSKQFRRRLLRILGGTGAAPHHPDPARHVRARGTRPPPRALGGWVEGRWPPGRRGGGCAGRRRREPLSRLLVHARPSHHRRRRSESLPRRRGGGTCVAAASSRARAARDAGLAAKHGAAAVGRQVPGRAGRRSPDGPGTGAAAAAVAVRGGRRRGAGV